MSRYLNLSTVKTYLNLGKTVEAFLGRNNNNGHTISFITLSKSDNDKIEVTIIHANDEGNLEFLDLYDFSYVDDDEDSEKIYFDNIEELIDSLQKRFQLNDLKFVNQGMCQDEYEDLLKSDNSHWLKCSHPLAPVFLRSKATKN